MLRPKTSSSGEDQGLLEPLAFFLKLGDEQFDTGVKGRRERRAERFQRM